MLWLVLFATVLNICMSMQVPLDPTKMLKPLDMIIQYFTLKDLLKFSNVNSSTNRRCRIKMVKIALKAGIALKGTDQFIDLQNIIKKLVDRSLTNVELENHSLTNVEIENYGDPNDSLVSLWVATGFCDHVTFWDLPSHPSRLQTLLESSKFPGFPEISFNVGIDIKDLASFFTAFPDLVSLRLVMQDKFKRLNSAIVLKPFPSLRNLEVLAVDGGRYYLHKLLANLPNLEKLEIKGGLLDLLTGEEILAPMLRVLVIRNTITDAIGRVLDLGLILTKFENLETIYVEETKIVFRHVDVEFLGLTSLTLDNTCSFLNTNLELILKALPNVDC
jgi:hypothetical protein